MRGVSVELKLVFAILSITIVAGVTGVTLTTRIFEENAHQMGVQALRTAAAQFAAEQRAEVDKLTAAIDALQTNPDLRAAFAARDRGRLQALAAPLLATLGAHGRVTHWYFYDPEPESTVFLRVHRPELFGDRVERTTYRRAVETKDVGAGLELGKTAFALRVVRPWTANGKLLGYVELAEEVDGFLEALKGRTGDEYGLIVKKKFLDQVDWARVLGPRANTWNDRPDVVVVDTTTFTEGIVDYEGDLEEIPDAGLALGEVERGERAYMRGIFPVRDAAGRQVGGLFVLHDFTGNHGAIHAAFLQALLVTIALVVLGGLAIAALVHALVFTRLARLRRRLEARAAEEGLPPGRVVALPSADEVGRLEAFFERLMAPSRRRAETPQADRERGAGA